MAVYTYIQLVDYSCLYAQAGASPPRTPYSYIVVSNSYTETGPRAEGLGTYTKVHDQKERKRVVCTMFYCLETMCRTIKNLR